MTVRPHSPHFRRALPTLLGIALLLASSRLAQAAGGDRVPDDTFKPQHEDGGTGLLSVMKGEIHFKGTVLDKQTHPLPGMQVRIYVNGMVAHTAVTDHVGQYDFRVLMNTTGKETIAMWFLDPSGKLSPKALVLAENAACREKKLLSRCYQRIAFEPLVESRVHLFDKDTRAQQIFASECM
jgi:hypothetical protein